MKKLALPGVSLALAMWLALALPAVAPAAEPAGREIIADVGRIVAPHGVQENFKLRIGGIEPQRLRLLFQCAAAVAGVR